MSLLFSYPCFAYLSDDEVLPLKYVLEPSVGVHLEVSELRGNGALSGGPEVGFGLRIERDVYFFTPDVGLIEMVGLERSPLTLLSAGFTAGGHVRGTTTDLYAGALYRTFLAYKVNPAVLGRVGISFNFGISGTQFYVEGTLGQVSEVSTAAIVDYSNLGFDSGLRFPLSN